MVRLKVRLHLKQFQTVRHSFPNSFESLEIWTLDAP